MLIRHLSSFNFLWIFILINISCTKKQNFNDKILNLTVAQHVKGLDPVNAADVYSSEEIARVYEGLLKYHYLKRPYELVPNLASEMPEVSSDGLTYTFKIKKNVLFHNNDCFEGGKGRELKAHDFVYSIQRMADPRVVSLGWWLLDEKIKGLNEWAKRNKDLEKTNYDDLDIEGLKALDDYTLQFKLTKPYPQFLYSLAMSFTYAVPREAVEYYGEEFLNNPVGTGPFTTGTFKQTNQIVYIKNPNYRDEFYPSEGAPGDKEKGLLESAGKKLPLVEKIIVNILVEDQPRWLAFEKGKTEFLGIPKDNFDNVVSSDKAISKDYAKKGISLDITPDLDITYIIFNHDDPLFKDNEKLRQAMSLAYNNEEANKLFYNNTGIIAHTLIPPGIGGYDKDYKNPYMRYDLKLAKKLLSEAGYPDGKGLPVLKFDTVSQTVARQMSEFFQKQMDQIGIKVEILTNTWPQLVQKVKKRQSQIYSMGWIGDYPDAENFLQLLYGPNASPGPNGANYNNHEFNKLFKQVSTMQASPQRDKLYAQMAQKFSEKVPVILGVHRTSFVVRHSWFKNFKFSTFSYGNSMYWDVDLKDKEETLKKL